MEDVHYQRVVGHHHIFLDCKYFVYSDKTKEVSMMLIWLVYLLGRNKRKNARGNRCHFRGREAFIRARYRGYPNRKEGRGRDTDRARASRGYWVKGA